MNKLKKREKILLFVLALVLAGIAPYFFVTQNLMAQVKATGDDLEVLQERKAAYELAEANSTKTEKTLENLRAQVLQMQSNGGMSLNKSYDMHYVFTKLAADNHVNMQLLSIGEPETVDIGLNEEPLAEGTPVDKDRREPEKIQVILNVNGSFENVLALADSIDSADPNFVIESFTASDLSKQSQTEVQLVVGIYLALSNEERIQISGN